MSDIKFNCPECQSPLEIDAAGAGMRVNCPQCGKPIVIPSVRPVVARQKVSIPIPAPPNFQSPGVASNCQPRSSAAAVWSLVLGILSFLCLGPLMGIPAIICGHTARANIRHSAGSLTGSGMALAGLIMGYITTVVFIVVFVFGILGGIAIPSFMKARETSQKNACVNNMRMMEASKEQWALETKQAQGATVDTAACLMYMKTTPVCPAGGTYTWTTIGVNVRCGVPGHQLSD